MKAKKKTSKIKTTIEKAGFVTVDSGLMQLGDPCYTSEGVPQVVLDRISKREMSDNDINQIDHEKGNPGKAVVVYTGYGDGIYPVFIERNKEGQILSVMIDFDIYGLGR